jgi:hypothetical protein
MGPAARGLVTAPDSALLPRPVLLFLPAGLALALLLLVGATLVGRRRASLSRRQGDERSPAVPGTRIEQLLVGLMVVVAAFADYLRIGLPAIESPAIPRAALERLVPLGVLVAGAGLCTMVAAVRLSRTPKSPDSRAPRKAAAVGALVASGTACLVALAIGMVLFSKPSDSSLKNQCMSHILRLMRAVRAYERVHLGVFPRGHRWCDQIRIYVEANEDYMCPTRPLLSSGYALNGALAGITSKLLADPRSVVVVFESDSGWNAVGGPELLPKEPRHLGGDDYGFADGSVRWYPRSKAKEVQWTPVLKEPVDGGIAGKPEADREGRR